MTSTFTGAHPAPGDPRAPLVTGQEPAGDLYRPPALPTAGEQVPDGNLQALVRGEVMPRAGSQPPDPPQALPQPGSATVISRTDIPPLRQNRNPRPKGRGLPAVPP